MKTIRRVFRGKSTRLQNWDYGWNGAYFITICTRDRIHYFGEIVDKRLEFSKIGIIADVLWHESRFHYKAVDFGAFVVMPDHIHMILQILAQQPQLDSGNLPEEIPDFDFDVQTRHALSQSLTPAQLRFRNQGKRTVSSIIGGYKSAVSKHAHRLGFEFGWQPLFWDSLIETADDYKRIENYIINNPANWHKKNHGNKPTTH